MPSHSAVNPYPESAVVRLPRNAAKARTVSAALITAGGPNLVTRGCAHFAATSIPAIIGSSRTPVPSASLPSTAWRYCGSTNIRPDRTNMPRVAASVLSRKPRRASRVRSRSGRSLRRSRRTRAVTRATEAANRTSTTGSVQPRCGASMIA